MHNTHNAYMYMHTHAPTHTMHTTTRRGERRLIGLQDCLGRGRGGLTFSQIKYKNGGEGGPLAIRHQTRGIDQPPWLQACIHTHTWHTCTYTHLHIHTCIFTHIHAFTHNAHINTHAHVCMRIASCAYTYTYTEILLDSKYTLREVRFFAIGTTQKSV